jgi:hypothetical protein
MISTGNPIFVPLPNFRRASSESTRPDTDVIVHAHDVMLRQATLPVALFVDTVSVSVVVVPIELMPVMTRVPVAEVVAAPTAKSSRSSYRSVD